MVLQLLKISSSWMVLRFVKSTFQKSSSIDGFDYILFEKLNFYIYVKGLHLLIMSRFNRGLVFNKFFMDMIKYGWNILSSHTK
jgi:hypothetical protein